MDELSIEVKLPDTALMKGHGPRIAAEEMLRATHRGVQITRSAVLPFAPVDRGFVRKGIQTSVADSNAEGVLGRVFVPIGHALPMETGTKAFFPPVEPLIGWVQRRLGVSEKEARHVAFLVARSIAKKGIKGRRFFAQGWAQAKPLVELGYETALLRIQNRLNGASA
jgi:hypothetical protein